MVKIQVLGPGCPKCAALADNARRAADEMRIEFELVKVTDINEILALGVMMTPALAVDGVVKIVGKVASPEEIRRVLSA